MVSGCEPLHLEWMDRKALWTAQELYSMFGENKMEKSKKNVCIYTQARMHTHTHIYTHM